MMVLGIIFILWVIYILIVSDNGLDYEHDVNEYISPFERV